MNATTAFDTTSTQHEAAAKVASFAREADCTLTRLLCADCYLRGIFSSASTFLSIVGVPYRARDPNIGYDRHRVFFHACQSGLLSLALLSLALAVLYLGGPTPYVAPHTWLLGLLAIKIAVVNPWLARYYFSDEGDSRELTIPGLATAAQALWDWLQPVEADKPANTAYFAGERPFVGHGTEVNAWTLVIDTSARGQGVHDLVDGAKEGARPPAAEDLYAAVLKSLETLEIRDLKVDWRTFVTGKQADKEKRLSGSRFRRPPEYLSPVRLEGLNREGMNARRYLTLSMSRPKQDLFATQFVRFQQDGRLIFCEFASYILAPALKRFYIMDRLFHINAALYNLAGLPFLLGATLLCLFDYLILGALTLVRSSDWSRPGFFYPAEVLNAIAMLFRGNYTELLYLLSQSGVLTNALLVGSLTLLTVLVAWRLIRWIFSTLGIALRLTAQFGITFTYRERFSSRGNLAYYSLQEVIRFLKTQEKILIKSLYDELKERGIDTSDLKDSVVAYINQGVINSGDIRGDVFTSIKSFVFRRPARSIVKKSTRRATAHA
jgi:hypothetical protein